MIAYLSEESKKAPSDGPGPAVQREQGHQGAEADAAGGGSQGHAVISFPLQKKTT